MTDLTEKWRKGELEVGEEYWVILTDEWYLQRPVAPVRAFYSCDHEFEGYYDNDIKEILAPVPSYEEWKAKDVALTYLLAEHGRLTKELQDEKEKHITRPSLRSPADEMVIEKQVWESTLNRSMKLQAENEELKEILKEAFVAINEGSYFDQCDILKKIDEVLK